jgi:hypothetical protein
MVISYNPVARIHGGGPTAEGEMGYALGVCVRDRALFSEWLETLSKSEKEVVKRFGIDTLNEVIAYKPVATILDIKTVLARQFRLPVASLLLVQQGRPLADTLLVKDLRAELEGPLVLVVRR